VDERRRRTDVNGRVPVLGDAERIVPHEEVAALKASGLLAITVPAAHGGADVSVETLTEVVRLLSTADPSIGQIPHSPARPGRLEGPAPGPVGA
jgi:alkylation response protein AidB-like acyl-CoA dehydrogenase